MANRKCLLCESELLEGYYKCRSCGAWNTTESAESLEGTDAGDNTVTLDKAVAGDADRLYIGPWSGIWGVTKLKGSKVIEGVVRTSVTLVGGSPGAGKSTMMLQMADAVADGEKGETLYIATEEAIDEVKIRAVRLGVKHMNLIRMVPAMSGGVNLNVIFENHKTKLKLILLDSLVGLCGEDDELQMKILDNLKGFAVSLKAPIIVITHVTKDLGIAGLMKLQHKVDTVMTFFPDEDGVRTLEVQKNRFGRAFINTEFEMTETGLVLIEPTEDDDEEE